jgi:hypothetical protein
MIGGVVSDEGQTGYAITVALGAAGVGVLTPKQALGKPSDGVLRRKQ